MNAVAEYARRRLLAWLEPPLRTLIRDELTDPAVNIYLDGDEVARQVRDEIRANNTRTTKQAR